MEKGVPNNMAHPFNQNHTLNLTNKTHFSGGVASNNCRDKGNLLPEGVTTARINAYVSNLLQTKPSSTILHIFITI